MRHLMLTAVLAGASLMIVARAAADDAAPTTQSAPADHLEATITGVEGLVQVRDSETQPWRKATMGMVVKEDAEFRTGPKSAVRFVIPPDQTVTLDRLGTVKLLQAVKQDGKIKTNIGMKYGRTRYDIEAAGQEHESKISSPSSTLAVRGTKVSLYDQRPFPVEAVSLTGRADFRDGKKQLAFGAKGQGKTKVSESSANAASTALDLAVVDPSYRLGRTTSESTLISTLISRGSTLSFDRDAGIKVVSGGVPPTDEQLIPALPGQLNFVLRWTTPGSDLNLTIGSPGGPNNAGELLYPVAGLSRTRSGGQIAFDHRGGPNGGIEIAYWTGKFPQGLYGIGAVLASGGVTSAQVDAFVGGARVKIFDGTALVDSVSLLVAPLTPGLGEGTAAGIVGIGVDVPGSDGGGGGEPIEPLSVSRSKTKSLQTASINKFSGVRTSRSASRLK